MKQIAKHPYQPRQHAMARSHKSWLLASSFALLSLTALAVVPLNAMADPLDIKPFDMAPVTPPPAAATPPIPPLATSPAPAVAPQAAIADAKLRQWRRYIVPSDTLSFNGEHYQHSWTINLTAREAASSVQLNLGYQNAILVAPESSYFVISINNVEILHQPIQSSEHLSEIVVDLPKDLLKAGANIVSIRAQQRHRTDCTIESTYELWTNIDGAKTFLNFALPPQQAETVVETLPFQETIAAIGVNAKGGTHFDLIAPGLSKGDNGSHLLSLSQALAMLGNMPNQSFSVEKFLTAASLDKAYSQSGELLVLVGTKAELTPILEDLQLQNADPALKSLRFISHNPSGRQILLVSGESWREVEQNIAQLVVMTERPANTLRASLKTQNWNMPDAKILRESSSLTFAELGIATQEFSGRRLRNEFTFGVPADFYANAYGSATVLLDAAYSAEVLPGSRIDIYVNGNIATTIPISNSGGGVMKQLPINMAMRNFSPGLNTVTIEAVLLTKADTICTPGTASAATPRFALFDTSKFKMPAFGRIGQTPNLAATAGVAYPYNYASSPMQVFANLNDYNVLSASATILGNLANAAGKVLPLSPARPEQGLNNSNALIVGAITNLPDLVLAQVGISPKAKGIWSDDDAAEPKNEQSRSTLNQWQEQLQSGWSGRLKNFYANIRETFNLSEGLRLLPGEDVQFIPSKADSVLAAQGVGPVASGAWTIFTAPDTVMLRKGAEILTRQENWNKIEGRISTYNRETQSIDIVAAQNMRFQLTQPLSFTNLRLIATNWFSSNALAYVLTLLVILLILGLSTSAMLSRFGRHADDQ